MSVKTRSRCNRGEALSLVDTIAGSGSIAGATLQFTVKKYKSDVSALLTKTTGAGNVVITDPVNRIVTINFTSAETNALLPGTYVFDLWRTDVGFETDYSDGTLTISERVAVTV